MNQLASRSSWVWIVSGVGRKRKKALFEKEPYNLLFCDRKSELKLGKRLGVVDELIAPLPNKERMTLTISPLSSLTGEESNTNRRIY